MMHIVYSMNFKFPVLFIVIAYFYVVILDDILKVQQWTLMSL